MTDDCDCTFLDCVSSFGFCCWCYIFMRKKIVVRKKEKNNDIRVFLFGRVSGATGMARVIVVLLIIERN